MRPGGHSFSVDKVNEWLRKEQLAKSQRMKEAHRQQRLRHKQQHEARKEKLSQGDTPARQEDGGNEAQQWSSTLEESGLDFSALFDLVGNLIARAGDQLNDMQSVTSSQSDAEDKNVHQWMAREDLKVSLSRVGDFSEGVKVEEIQFQSVDKKKYIF
ncbi:hypothetical protein GUITHDRAFT_155855 [Guillardia theta CCMP2712]|uniref:Uncharacterized protein n=3 Tax=Eukaryota TaxID=2759 RepID=L1ICR7_GUITC|nr:hypothetical protein GUITHDRAFT_155855 [Guillardia theta CCMP2712]EKX34046.1 hypothetical protein GUITHDRAFT_155855 [Guillardia theta CCMP2712]|mmetsp:Transcript_46884/g.146952  ORF Transcript_46884/g.146952 Transcript_46884/m.146952 type:complete len:157 (-) Transcript_46884:468-938(-)|eukprot:XP_005821026.1 hypothetical protein GUITHDRAFT_155855 [Guillardia theta CCMP2712]